MQAKCGGYLGRPINIRIKDDDGTLVVSRPVAFQCMPTCQVSQIAQLICLTSCSLLHIPGVQEGCNTTNTTAFIWWTVFFEFFLLVL